MSKGTILVVEPDDDIRNMVKIYFSGQGYLVVTCTNYDDALEASRKQLPSVIVTEIDLPDKSGWDLVKALMATTRTSHIPIIFLTALDNPNKISALKTGNYDFVPKPFDIEELKLHILNATESYIDDSSLLGREFGLPIGKDVEKYLVQLVRSNDWDWCFIEIVVDYFFVHQTVSWEMRTKVVQHCIQILRERISKEDFFAYQGKYFLIISRNHALPNMLDSMLAEFKEARKIFYSDDDLARNAVILNSKQIPLIELAYGVFDGSKIRIKDFDDIFKLVISDRCKRRGADDPEFSTYIDKNIEW